MDLTDPVAMSRAVTVPLRGSAITADWYVRGRWAAIRPRVAG